MITSFYTGLTGLRSNQKAVEVVSDNIANVNTTGYKASSAQFQDLFNKKIGNSKNFAIQSQIGLGTQLATVKVDHSNGTFQFTGNDLDFALEGEGFFVVGDANADYTTGIDSSLNPDPTTINDRSELRYTRDGSFTWNSVGELVNSNGDYVLKDVGGGIFNKILKSDPTNAVLTDVIAIATIPNEVGLEKLGGNNYIENGKTGVPVFGKSGDLNFGTVRQQLLEMSNVDLGLEFTRLIVSSRAFQANSRTITTSDEMLQELINIKR